MARAALSKAAALISCLLLAATALLMTGTFGFALAAEGQITGQTAETKRNGLIGKIVGLSQAADTVQKPPDILFLIWGLRSTR